jgi:hypothetical protein
MKVEDNRLRILCDILLFILFFSTEKHFRTDFKRWKDHIVCVWGGGGKDGRLNIARVINS